jgi:alpha-N-arabinofuranosidase
MKILNRRKFLVARSRGGRFSVEFSAFVMANIVQLVNCLPWLFLADGNKSALTPTYHVFEMFAAHQGATNVRAICSARNIKYDHNNKPADFWGLSGSAPGSYRQRLDG